MVMQYSLIWENLVNSTMEVLLLLLILIHVYAAELTTRYTQATVCLKTYFESCFRSQNMLQRDQYLAPMHRSR